MIFFTSDTHFGHANIISKFIRRPFSSVEEMDESMINDWNSIVKPIDTVYHLGDFSWSKTPNLVFDRLNGFKHLIIGNHDLRPTKNLNWESKNIYLELEVCGKFIVLFHYPIVDWNRRPYGAWHLFGHVHNAKVPKYDNSKSLDVGVDSLVHINNNVGYELMDINHPYAPISFEQLEKYFQNIGNK